MKKIIFIAFAIILGLAIIPFNSNLTYAIVSEEQMEYHDNLVFTNVDGFFNNNMRPTAITTTNSDYLVISTWQVPTSKTHIHFVDKNFTDVIDINLNELHHFKEFRYDYYSNIAYAYEMDSNEFILVDTVAKEVIDIINIQEFPELEEAYILDVAGINGYFFVLTIDWMYFENGLLVFDSNGELLESHYLEYDGWYCIDVAIRGDTSIDIVLGGYDYVSLSEYGYEGYFDWYKVVTSNPKSNLRWSNCRISSEDDFKSHAWFYGGYDYQATVVGYWNYYDDWDMYMYPQQLDEYYSNPYPLDNSYYDETAVIYDPVYMDGEDINIAICNRNGDIERYYLVDQLYLYSYDISVDNYYNYSVYSVGNINVYEGEGGKGNTIMSPATYYGIHVLYNDYEPQEPYTPPTPEPEEITPLEQLYKTFEQLYGGDVYCWSLFLLLVLAVVMLTLVYVTYKHKKMKKIE